MPNHYETLLEEVRSAGLQGAYDVWASENEMNFWRIERWRGPKRRDCGIRFSQGTTRKNLNDTSIHITFYGDGSVAGTIDGEGAISDTEPHCEDPLQEFVEKSVEIIAKADWQPVLKE
ncbi:MAG: hypothetical protein QF486_00965 [Candidatus Woesearchaeota archaeon]|jgi:hypothetical protein|nr:hypothetical protein [Candidatus Woesearchaeota archaeon]MDP7181210.1 hypothetical protein [Candidatus Woesearchaeota archaeon]MDP7198170.1 hypothetical protein [Candidatus Woesearchaeota archaeon]MDP7467005.1 hypothetical protein [Candidatus Woesearchaeota archaeon]MDP7646675.1 hypothetical protein [Candidatus Woesearchaeota archaeon]